MALGAASCGGGAEDDARAAISALQKAFADGDREAICAALTRDAQRHVGGMGHDGDAGPRPEDCAEDLPIFSDNVKEIVARDVVDVRVEGRRAIATVEFGEGATGEVPLAREGGEWKVDALYGGVSAKDQEDSY